jgi:glycosyltransferase involved in cell wall biosynthesis
MRVLILLAKHKDASTASAALRREIPRPEYLLLQEGLGADLIDFSDVESSTHPLVRLARRWSFCAGLAMLAFTLRGRYEQFYCTGEDVGMPFAALMALTRRRDSITCVIHSGGTRSRRLIFRAVPSSVWRNFIALSQEQWRVLVDEVGLPRAKVHSLRIWLDTRFYDPARASLNADAPTEYAMSCGRESRDYALLAAAADALPIQFLVVASGWAPHSGFATATGIRSGGNIRVESARLSYIELRSRYKGARLVVVPAKNVTYAAGVTSITEAMSMGKTVVATDSPGIRDYIEEGVTGAVVPTGDPAALRAALVALWADPAALARIGARNRQYAVEQFSVEKYVMRVADLLGIAITRGPMSAVYDGV